jgi:hypothetical protein
VANNKQPAATRPNLVVDFVEDSTYLEYVYLTEHSTFWRDKVPVEIGQASRVCRDLELRGRDSIFFRQFLAVHEQVAALIQQRCDEGMAVALDISHTLAEIKGFYETNEEKNRVLLRYEGHIQ